MYKNSTLFELLPLEDSINKTILRIFEEEKAPQPESEEMSNYQEYRDSGEMCENSTSLESSPLEDDINEKI